MQTKKTTPFHPHDHDRKVRGCTIDYQGKSLFLRPGDNYTDFRGRRYTVAEDGSLRRVRDGK